MNLQVGREVLVIQGFCLNIKKKTLNWELN